MDMPSIELGKREEDLTYNWNATFQNYQQYGSLREFQCYIETMKENDKGISKEVDMPNVMFSEDQQKVIELINKQVLEIKTNQGVTIKRTLIQGKAGTGKSLLIKYITSNLNKDFGQDSYILAAPTGVAAIQINGQTIQSIFKIPSKRKDFRQLTGERARDLNNLFQKVKFLILDEYSMVGCSLLAMIDLRCKQATGVYNEDFGGLIVYLLGDGKQLPAVKDSPLYSTQQSSLLAKHGKNVFQNFEATFMLKECHRQTDKTFLSILDDISNGDISESNYEKVASRFQSRVGSSEKKAFDDAIRLFATKEEVKTYNMKKMSELRDANTGACTPIARIPADHNCKNASRGTSDDAQGLEAVLYLAKGCEIMLRNNVWVTKGLVNGAVGEVVDILYDHDENPQNSKPKVILCKFESYKGPNIIPNQNIVPIAPVLRSWTTSDGEKCTRYQFPISICFACSIHKSQGLTLHKAVVDIGPREVSLGLSYVALSRVRSLEGLLINDFASSRISKLKECKAMQDREIMIDFLKSLQR